MTRPRDNQRQRVYDAEKEHSSFTPIQTWVDWDRNERHVRHVEAFYLRYPEMKITYNSISRPEPELRPIELREVRSYVNKKVRSAWFQKTFKLGFSKVIVRTRKGNARAYAIGSWNGPVLEFPCWSRWPIIILHELAHAVTPQRYAAHGPEFARNYIKLVSHYIGTEAARELKATFRAHLVDYRRPNTNGTHRV